MKLSLPLALSCLPAVLGVAVHTKAEAKVAPKGRWFDRFVVVVLENTNKATALGTPYYQNLTQMGMLLNGYQGTTHPSQPNYITMIHSTIAGGVYDDADHNTTQYSLVDLLEPAGSIPRAPVLYKPADVPVGSSWRAYMEGYYPLANGACNTIGKNLTSGYVRKHNPFMSFLNIQNNTARCQQIVNAESTFVADVAKGAAAPQYMYYVPNLKNDAHDTNVTYAVADLQHIMDTMLNNKAFMKNTLIIVTFDENDIYSPQFYGTPNDVYTVLLGNDTIQCYDCIDQQFYNHFSQLNTVEMNWNLSTIPNADGNGPQWDSYMLPFAMLKESGDDPACAHAPCSEQN